MLLKEPVGVRVDLDSLNEPDGVRTTTFTDWLRPDWLRHIALVARREY